MEVQRIEVYCNEKYKAEKAFLNERLKNFHFFQLSSPYEFDMVNEPQVMKFDNNIYFKKFNLIKN